MALLVADDLTKTKNLATLISCKIYCILVTQKFQSTFLAKYKTAFDFWTSGANEGEFCDTESIFSWCSIEKRVRKEEIKINWSLTTNQPTAAQRCLDLKVGKDASVDLALSDCASKLPFVCQVHILKWFIIRNKSDLLSI